jgi:hypothetical protein
MDVPAAENYEHVQFNFSSRHLLGACFLSEGTFSDMAHLLEAVYHESLHLKFFNFILTQKIFTDDPHSAPPPKFECPWMADGEDRYWYLDRVFAAFHVYVHLHVLYALLWGREVTVSAISKEWAEERLSVSDHKGRILMHWLDEHLPKRLTPEGQNFYSALRDIFLRSIALRKGVG